MWSSSHNSQKGRGKGYGKGKSTKGWTSAGWETAPSWESSGKGKGHDWHSGGDWNQGWGEEKGQSKGKGQPRDYMTRLEGRYAFAKAVLRPYADEHGSAIYSNTAGSAMHALGKDNLRQVLDWRNSELVRRPAVGISTISGSLKSLSSTLETCSENDHLRTCLENLAGLLKGRRGKAFLDACDVLIRERTGTVTPEKLAEAIKSWLAFFREHKTQLSAELPKLAAAASALYLGSV